MEVFNCLALVRKTPSLVFSPETRVSYNPVTRISRANGFKVPNSISYGVGVPKHFQWKSGVLKDLSRDLQDRTGEVGVSEDLEKETEKLGDSDELSGGRDDMRVLEELRKEAEETLEWKSICSQVASFASTSMGRALCGSGDLPIGRDRRESQKLLDQTAAVVLLPRPLDFSGIEDVLGIVRLAVSGELLTIRELCAVERSLRAARGLFEQLAGVSSGKGSSNRYPLLEILQKCNFLTELVCKIGFCIDCNLSVILDQASKKLVSIRSERKRNLENLDSLLKGISTRIFQAGGIDSPLITKRRSRMCIGIRASHKSLLPDGIILGVSSSGATYFMEPRDAVELNNMEVRLSNSEKAEELAILGLLSSKIASFEIEIRYLMERILELDLAYARGAYALWMKCVCPVFSEDHEEFKSNKSEEILSVDIEGICHPLLLEPSLRNLSSAPASSGSSIFLNEPDGAIESGRLPEGETVVPLDIKIRCTTKVVVISGPNTGGKTATMKTLGLASLMSKAGMFLPAKNRPRLPWFNQVLADIGDHQSLEHNLSTFSGHISRLSKILHIVSEQSLVLIDEIGNGTDPSEGVALSTSILQYLADRVGLAVVTTHYAELSRLKDEDSRFENAAMEFCIKTLQPTYRILWGSTGNSNALSIAKSIGFDQKVLVRAQEWVEKLVPDKQKERQGLLYQSLLEERNVLEAQASKAASILSDVKMLYHEIHSEAKDLDRQEAALKAKESQRVHQELKAARSQMDAVVKNFENQLQNASPDQYNSIMRQSEAAIAAIVEAHCLSGELSLGETDGQSSYIPQVGDQVRVKGLGNGLATVVEAPGDDGTTMVQYGKIRVRAKKDDMKLIQSGAKDTSSSSVPCLKGQDQQRYFKRSSLELNKEEDISYGPVVRTSKNTADLRGMRVEEASNYLKMAIAGSRSYGVLFVIHGTGTGAIKECALGVLRNHPRVVKFEEESPMNYGCTIAYIK